VNRDFEFNPAFRHSRFGCDRLRDLSIRVVLQLLLTEGERTTGGSACLTAYKVHSTLPITLATTSRLSSLLSPKRCTRGCH
jgi:hypothetical protein